MHNGRTRSIILYIFSRKQRIASFDARVLILRLNLVVSASRYANARGKKSGWINARTELSRGDQMPITFVDESEQFAVIDINDSVEILVVFKSSAIENQQRVC